MLQKNLIAMAHFGRRYPAPPDEERKFFDETPKQELGAIFRRAIEEPITRNGLDLDELRQGSFFTHQGKRLVPGTSSHATPRALVELTLKLEQGRLVDAWSSRELKRLMYVTERRIRYGSAGVLQPAALYFKSGSLYSCAAEEGFVCRKYHGNRRNYMNSVAIIESPAGQNHLFYSVALLSNVLRKNSAEDHRDLAQAIHGLLLADHPPKAIAAGESAPETRYGEGFIGYEQERRAMQLRLDTQQALLALGYEIGEIDGVIGPNTRAAIRRFQRAAGEQGDAEPSEALLAKLRAAAASRGASQPAPSPAP
jgi:hypothetical protein